MRLPVCRHYWENGRDAVWRPAAFPSPRIEAAVKSDYLALQTERPAWKKYGGFWAVFDYRPAKDVFGRDIVPISMAFLPCPPDPAAQAAAAKLLPLVAERLARAPQSAAFIDVPEAPGETPAPAAAAVPRSPKGASPAADEKNRRKLAPRLLLAASLAFALLALLARLWPSPGKEPVNPGAPPSSGAASPPVSSGPPSAPPPEAAALPHPPASICESSRFLLPCPRLYIERRCAGRANLPFREFREQSDACRPPYGNPEAWSRKLKIFRETPDAQSAAVIEKFLFGEEE